MKLLNHSLLLLAALIACAPAGAAPKLLHYQTKVVDANNQPLAGVVVERYRLPGFLGGAGASLQLEESVTSDTAGSVSFTSTNGGVFMLFARKPGLSASWSVWLPGFPAAELGGARELVLTAPAAVSGMVQDAAGRPVPDAAVWVSAASRAANGAAWLPLHSQLGRKFLATRTGPKGEFRIEGLPADVSLDLAAAKPGLALDQPTSTPFGGENLTFQAGDSKIVLPLKPAGALAGQVVHEDFGAPVAGARVSIVQNEWNDEAASGRTGADGRFLLADLRPGEHRVRAVIGPTVFSDWVCEETAATVEAGTTNRDLKLTALRGGVLEVTVRHADHQPATEAVVGISRDTFNQLGIVSDQGIARFRLPAGEYELFAFAEDYQGHQEHQSVVNGETNRVEMELEAGNRITGVVLGADGKPASQVKVTLLPFLPVEKSTDAEGRFTLALNQFGQNNEAQRWVIARDLAHNLAAIVNLEEDATNLTLRLQPGLTLAGSITDKKGKAITNASAQVMFRTERMTTTLGVPVPVDAQGHFELKGLPLGQSYTVTASAKGFGQDKHEIESGDTATNHFTLAPLQLPLADRRVAGRVVDAEDKPVAGAWVNGSGEHQPNLTGRSDAQGHFRFDHVCAGQINIGANTMHGGYGNVAAEAGDTNVTVQLGATHTFPAASGNGKLSGTVKDKDGKPATKVMVTLFPFTGTEKATDAEGHFKLTFNPTQWGGEQDMPRIVIARDVGADLAAALDIEADATNADLKLEPALTLAGRVTGPQDKPLTNATVQVMLQTDRFGTSLGAPVPVNATGRFEIKALPADRKYTLTASAKGFGKEQRTIEPAESGTRRVEVQKAFQLLPADQRIAGVVLDADDKPVAKASLYCYGDKQPDLNGQTDAKGHFAMEHVCAGSIRISANAPRGNGYANLTAESGDTNIVIHLQSSSSQRAEGPRMTRLQGKPLPDLAPLGVAAADCPKDQPILAVLIDAEQRPSRRMLRQLADQAGAFKLKGVTVVVLQAGGMTEEAFAAWKKEAALPFPTGCLKGEPEKARTSWGAGAMPWLVLTDKDHKVAAEGFSLDELDAKLSAASK
jgi:hypothetical protein